jgi:murein DD-endopeptidase MepM/ murein hydrolase activator NlpD
MAKSKKPIFVLALIPVIIIVFLIGWFFITTFEGEKPVVSLQPLPEFFSKIQKFNLSIVDQKRGLKRLKISVKQEGREINVLEKKFPFEGLLNRQGQHQFEKEIFIDPFVLNLAQGRVDLYVRVWDYSRRGGGDGNLTLIHHKMTVDTIPPAIRAISRMHNVYTGGTGLVIYQASSDTKEDGLFVDGHFSPGFPVDGNPQEGIRLCYFAMPHRLKKNPSVYLWAKDKADNVSQSTFYFHIIRKSFRTESLNITDRFLKRVLPYFSFYSFDPELSDVDKFLKINNDLRQENHHTLIKLMEKTSPERFWEAPFLRLKNAATMSRFADRRLYYYKKKKIDEKFHLGVDLASLSNSPVQAANHGKVLFAGRLGIYGLTVVLDHGEGLASIYGHLSKLEATPDQMVKKGDVIGFTGRTGLAGGDHLHFAIMVNGVMVNPIEWWDNHWIKDNVTRKLKLLKKETS